MNKSLELFLDVNHTKATKYLNLYQPAEGKASYGLLLNLINAGYKIPYHHRPKCRSCSHHYHPYYISDYVCDGCRRNAVSRQVISFSPSDLRELGVEPDEALDLLALPHTKETEDWFIGYTEDNSEIEIERLKHILGER